MRRWTKNAGLAFLLFIISAMTPTAAMAKLRLPSIVADHMVLQQSQPVSICGWAAPGEEITATIARQTAKAKADEKGRWQVEFSPLEAGGPLEMVISDSAGKRQVIKDVLVGEVWVCSGQSNMAWPVASNLNAKEEIKNANHPNIRLFTVNDKVAHAPQEDCEGNWSICSLATVGNYTAVGYFFARDLQKELGVPIGLLQTDWGGTPVETWTSRKALESEPTIKPLLDRWDSSVAVHKNSLNSPHRPANLYNAMIAPIVPYDIRGVIWYQGESNVARAHQYRTLFPLMIKDWREAWGQGQFPFYFVQIAPYAYSNRENEPYPTNCAELWEAQLLALKTVPNSGMAVTMDIGNVKDIHPRKKQGVGHRLALWALAETYGKRDIVYSGPIYESVTIKGNKIRLRFDHVDGGLATRDSEHPSHFTIAGADQKFHSAEAAIDGDTIVVESKEVQHPLAVRYAWRDDTEPNLMNKAGLPASPFRTDSWKGVTEGKHY